MAAPALNALLDLVEIATQGFHSGVDPKLLPDNQHWFGVNVTARGGHFKTRPPMRKIALAFIDDEQHANVAVNATTKRFQGAAFYEARTGKNSILASIGGRLFRYLITNNSATVSDLSLPSDLNSSSASHVWLFQGEEFMVINDGLDYPLFFDGAIVRRSLGMPQELPPSCMGHYVNGRFTVVLPDRRSFIAGDLVGGPSGTAVYNYRDAILKTTENISILGGSAFAIPLTSGMISALFSTAITDTSLGQGPLQIGTRKGIFSVDLPLDATQWTTTQQPSSVVSLPDFGPVSQHGVVAIHGDAWYRGKDGIRSFIVARRDFNTWVNTPLSSEMDAVLPFDTTFLLEYCSAVNFDNRLLMTCSPYYVIDMGVAHRGLIALDFNNVSSITARSQPDYDGLWTGLNILQVLTGEFGGVERCFAFALDEDDKICLYEICPTTSEFNFDWDGAEEVLTKSMVVTNAQFGRFTMPPIVRLPLKQLKTSDLFLTQLAGESVEFTIQYRSDDYPLWIDWKAFSICVPSVVCPDGETCEQPTQVHKQYATFIRLPEPSDADCDPITRRKLRTGYNFQFKLEWTGHACLQRMMNWAMPLTETAPSCPSSTECQLLEGCGLDYFFYSIES